MRVAILGVSMWIAGVVAADAQETVGVAVPSAVSFSVTDVSTNTTGSPSPATISFSNANLDPGKALRISVQADAPAFTPPAGPGIPASHVSWSTLGAAAGTGWNGTLSSTSYTLVFQSDPGPTSGHLDLEWTLAAPGGGIRAGTHQLTIRWKVESITP